MRTTWGKTTQVATLWDDVRGVKLHNERRDIPLPYNRTRSAVVFYREGPPDWPPTSESELSFRYDLFWDWNYASECNKALWRAESLAYSRLVEKLGTRSELGTTLMEWRSSLNMIVERAGQIGTAWLHLKRGRFKDFLRTLGLSAKPGHRSWRRNKPAEPGGLWLEYWMGWAPLLGDLYQSALVFADVLPSVTIRATAKAPWLHHKVVGVPTDEWRYDAWGTSRVLYQADVQISNPNVYLMNQLGMLNPALVAWNLMPWSWMLGWFGNFSQVISSLSDFAGITWSRGFTTHFIRGEGTGHYYYAYAPYARRTKFLWGGQRMRRMEGLVLPSLHLSVPPSLSVTRAATAVSLLLQRLKT